ncbi:response regulator [Streptomyces olindensis]|uniref:response regulator n=1 Tax=Streptomyces olindensis TaxID=358823 RepID=UPI0033FD7318
MLTLDVLVVDDDYRVAQINAAYVSRVPGFRVAGRAHTAAQAQSFLEHPGEQTEGRTEGRTGAGIDLVLLDHYLPDGSGLSLVRRLRERGLHTDVIMVTAARDVATVQAAMRHGALQYLVKPFAFAGLRAKLEGYAALRRALADGGQAEQHEVDRIFGAFGAATADASPLPKGHSAPTADLVREVLRAAGGPLAAHDVAARAGVSRQTARRYLKLMERAGRVRMSLRYGEKGRPEHLYSWTAPQGQPARTD